MIMMWRRTFPPVLLLAAGMMLAACSQPSAPTHKVVRSGNELVAGIQAAGARDDGVIRVRPLHQPGVGYLLDQAHQETARHDYKAAAGTLDKALKLAPKAPDILQERAQLAVRLGHYAKAEKLARRSFQLGPRIGALCARNWQTVLEMRRIANDSNGVQAARKALARCAKSGPARR